MNNILIVTDNSLLLNNFKLVISNLKLLELGIGEFHFAFSPKNDEFRELFHGDPRIVPLDIKNNVQFIVDNFDIVFSLHCKQLFPTELVNKVKCINVHPGLNPYNRGWYPQVFSIINGMPCGATIHEMDEFLDHGPVICQREVEVFSWDTSKTVYDRVLNVEIELLSLYLTDIILGKYETTSKGQGNLNLKKDFVQLCEIDLNNVSTFRNHLNHLRALTHGEYSNAFFIDENGDKVFIKIELTKVNQIL